MHVKKAACARKIDDVTINARRTRAHTRRYSAVMCIMLCMKSVCVYLVCTNCTRAFWFARTALVHFGLHEQECLIGVQSGLAYTQIIRINLICACVLTASTMKSILFMGLEVMLTPKPT